MSEEIKIEPVCDGYNQIESVASIVNNIKEEPEVEFELILPQKQVKAENENKKRMKRSFSAENVQELSKDIQTCNNMNKITTQK
jgi:hypothetical protein